MAPGRLPARSLEWPQVMRPASNAKVADGFYANMELAAYDT